MNNIAEALIVSVSFSDEKTGVLIVGKQTNGRMDIVNAFQDEEAMELFKRLTTVRKKGGQL